MTDDDLTRLRGEVAGVLGECHGCVVEDENTGRLLTCQGCAGRADALLPPLTRKIAEAWNAGYCTNRDPSAVKLAHLHNPYIQAHGEKGTV